ncbi:MAG: tetratricopeptide repeat protein [Spirochaetaceae bacterium]|jgi:tetratricopeptide (TPR) repeat protein|nr:tetratricopeptide repeat protein [Spirochaetaceae bacterium]
MADTLQEGIRLFRLKRWEGALKEFLAVDSSRFGLEENADLAYYLGLCYTKLERYDDALLYLEQVVTSGAYPLRCVQCRLALAYIYVITKRSRLAEFELKQLIDSGYESIQIYTTLAYAAWTQQQYEKAVEYYQSALDIDANNATALNGLGYILADAAIDPVKGLYYCKKAVDKKPQNAAYLDSLGWAYYKNGALIEARIYLRRAYDLAPQHEEIRRHLKTLVRVSS